MKGYLNSLHKKWSYRIYSTEESRRKQSHWANEAKVLSSFAIELCKDSVNLVKLLSRASLVAQLVKNLPAMWETSVWSLGWEDPLEKGTATHSSILAWWIPWTVMSMGSQRIRHDWETFSFSLYYIASQVALVVKNSPVKATRDVDWIPESGRPPGGGHGNSLQYSCLENPMDRGAWQATVYGVAKS